MLGKIDFTVLVDRMYRSIEEYRYAALYTAFMTIDESLPTDMILETAVSEATKDSINRIIAKLIGLLCISK